ncbi:MAG: hypothetical protein KJ044_00030, partial [Planctomycetes bacterium]|nr:hypothetical protein [Planctomycetota bacterium]
SAPDLSDVLGRNDELLAGLALSPVPLTLADLNALAAATGKSGLPVGDLVSSPLLQIAGDYVVPSAAEVTRRLREQLPPETLARGATLLLPIVEARYETLVDARVDLALRSGDTRRAGKLARRRFDEHLAAGRVEEALRMIEMARALGLSVESGRFAAETDDAKLAYLYALAGRHEPAADTVRRLARRRDAYGSADFVQWLALAARHLALHAGFEVRLTDSLLRRAIRLAGDDTSTHVRLTLLRVELLASPIMNLEERSSWLLSHINGEMLEDISPDVLAQYLEDTAHRMWRAQDVRGAMRRLRKLLVMERPDRQMARGMLLMARCRQVVADSDAALRFATGSLHHALRANDLSLVTQAAAFVREELARRPRELPKLAPKAAKGRPRIPAMADVAPPPLAEADRLFEILQARFGAAFWVRRRGETLRTFGKEQRAEVPVSVGQETDGGWRRVSRGPDGETRALVLLRADGSDMVVFEAGGEADLREDALARMLLADREVTGATTAQPPSRRTVLEDYHRRAVAHGGDRGLHATMEMLFNKDVLLYFEEQGIGKEEMAEKLGVSRATLYRMYARAGLNI